MQERYKDSQIITNNNIDEIKNKNDYDCIQIKETLRCCPGYCAAWMKYTRNLERSIEHLNFIHPPFHKQNLEKHIKYMLSITNQVNALFDHELTFIA